MGAKEETLQQRDLYKSHLEFLGFDVECDAEDPQDMAGCLLPTNGLRLAIGWIW